MTPERERDIRRIASKQWPDSLGHLPQVVRDCIAEIDRMRELLRRADEIILAGKIGDGIPKP